MGTTTEVNQTAAKGNNLEPVSPQTRFGQTATERRFVAVFVAVIVVFGIAAFTALHALEEIHDMMHSSVESSRRLLAAQRLESALGEMYARQADVIVSGDSSHLSAYENADRRMLELIAAQTTTEAATKALISNIATYRTELDENFRRSMFPSSGLRSRNVAGGLQPKQLAIMSRARKQLNAYSQATERALLGFDDHASTIAHSGFQRTLSLLILVALFTGVIGLYLGRSVARPVAILRAGAARVAAGDLDTQVAIAGPREFRELAEQFNQMVIATRAHQQRLLESERLAGLGRLAAGVAHEINNPLGVIRGYAGLVRSRTSDAQVIADVRVIEDECQRCGEIVQGLLDLSRPPIEGAAPTNLRELVDEVVERLNTSDKLPALNLDVAGSGCAWGNARSLRQVLTNLLHNAADASGEGGHVIIEIEESNSGVSRVSVTDDGPGFPEEDQNRIFEPFFTTKASGTGLGLAVSHAIVDAHGGRMTAKNLDGGGAQFVVELPVRPKGDLS